MQQKKRKLYVNWDLVLVLVLTLLFWVKVGAWIAGFSCWS